MAWPDAWGNQDEEFDRWLRAQGIDPANPDPEYAPAGGALSRAAPARAGAGPLAPAAPAPAQGAPRGFLSRVRRGLYEGGPVGGLIGLAADPYAPSTPEDPSWYDALQGVNRVAGPALRAAVAGDPSLVARERALELEGQLRQQQIGVDRLTATAGAAKTEIELRKLARQEAMIQRAQELGIDINTPEGRAQMHQLLIEAGMVDEAIAMLKDAQDRALPKAISWKEGDRERTRIYDPGTGTYEQFDAPRKMPGEDLGDFRQAWNTLASERRADLKDLLAARESNGRVLRMVDHAVETNNPLEAVAAVRSFIQAIDQSVVREEEYNQIAGSIGVLRALERQLQEAGGNVSPFVMRQVRGAASNALSTLDQIIARRDAPYRAAAERLQVPWEMIGSGGPAEPSGRSPSATPPRGTVLGEPELVR